MSVLLVNVVDYCERRLARIEAICERAAADHRPVDNLVVEFCEVGDLLEEARAALAVGDHGGTHATSVGTAELFYALEAEDPLPVGRLKHDCYTRLSAEERRAQALTVLRSTTGWVAPLFWATSNHEDVRARIYWRGALAREFCYLHREGLVQRRTTGKRGARYEYRLLADHRLVSVAS